MPTKNTPPMTYPLPNTNTNLSPPTDTAPIYTGENISTFKINNEPIYEVPPGSCSLKNM